MLKASLSIPPDLETKPTDPGRYSLDAMMFSIVPAVFPMRNAPAAMPPTVAGPSTILSSFLAVALITRDCLSGTPSAMTATTRMLSSARASMLVSKADLCEAKLTMTSASG